MMNFELLSVSINTIGIGSIGAYTLLATFTAAISSVIGMLGGVFLLGALLVEFDASVAIPLHGAAQLMSGSARVKTFWKDIRWDVATPFLLSVVPGALLGSYFIGHFSDSTLKGGVGLAILLSLFLPKRAQGTTYPKGVFALIGLLASGLGILIGASGPLTAPFFMGLGNRPMVATRAVCSAAIQLVKIPSFLIIGTLSFHIYWPILFGFLIAAFLGASLGGKLLSKISHEKLSIILKLLLACFALQLVIVNLVLPSF